MPEEEPEFGQEVQCDDDCGALLYPESVEELKAALDHWQTHSHLNGCAHGC